jgi:hypothetical protein
MTYSGPIFLPRLAASLDPLHSPAVPVNLQALDQRAVNRRYLGYDPVRVRLLYLADHQALVAVDLEAMDKEVANIVAGQVLAPNNMAA